VTGAAWVLPSTAITRRPPSPGGAVGIEEAKAGCRDYWAAYTLAALPRHGFADRGAEGTDEAPVLQRAQPRAVLGERGPCGHLR